MTAYKRENLSASRETQLALARSMKKLLAAQPLEKVSVGDIVRDCGVSRNTFYYHFRDKYDLIIWIFQNDTAEWMGEESQTAQEDELRVILLGDYLRENQAFYRNALAYTGQNSLRDYLDRKVYQLIEHRLQRILPPPQTQEERRELRFTAEFFTAALTGLFLKWIQEGMKEEIEGYHDCLRRILSGELLEGYLQRGVLHQDEKTG